jgi:hypothetical protein
VQQTPEKSVTAPLEYKNSEQDRVLSGRGDYAVVREGLEPGAKASEKQGSSKLGSAQSSALSADPDLAYLVQNWPKLSSNVRAVVLDIVRRVAKSTSAKNQTTHRRK